MGREGTCGGAPNASLLLGKGGSGPGRNGTGGAPEWGPGEGMAGAGPRPDTGRARGALSVGLLCVVGLGGGDLGRETDSVCPKPAFRVFYNFLTAFKKLLFFFFFTEKLRSGLRALKDMKGQGRAALSRTLPLWRRCSRAL